MADFRIETERLVLRNWVEGDLEGFAEATNTPAVMRWLGGEMDEAELAATRDRIVACHEDYGHCFWLVERKDDGGHLSGKVLGFCGLKRADAPDCTFQNAFEIGWRQREEACGKGYAKEAASASLDAAFNLFGAEEVVARTVLENAGSWGLMERLGMVRRKDLDFEDMRFTGPLRTTLVWSITPDIWFSHRADVSSAGR